ncbi:MAG: ribosome-associated translation inhibitor RaiA [Moraxella sp.]|nr:ribosome-associated translation inhibitor RaiA [Moraxella sp.]
MNIKITGHHISVSPELETLVMEKLAKPLRHFDQIQSIQVILSHDHNRTNACHAEAILRVSGQEMFVKADSDDMRDAIGGMADMLTRQVRKHKTRLERRHMAEAGKGKHPPAEVMSDDEIDEIDDYDEYAV